ncbi:endonuclease/exonuclease/phosphatase family protein [Streptomyces sp. NPDC021749]|uniref:endonuclease/exonuclease/phosphatase family protein n=1 Tax=Streptomyces sp. NPDC021749 TaxID=3154905 RepID=UPI0033C229EA
MTLRIATFNTENLFQRPRALALADEAERRTTLEDFATLVALLDHPTYSSEDKQAIAEILDKYDVADSQSKTRPFLVNETRGGAKLFVVRQGGAIDIVADGRAAWVGWAELIRDDIKRETVENTGRVIAEVDPDVLLTVEVEDRLTLQRFNEQVLADLMGNKRYPFNMLIDGNDSRGIDVGLFSRFPIVSIRSHLFDSAPDGRPVFSRDCPEFEIEFKDGKTLWILGNHFKSKGFGNPTDTANKRKAQAERVTQLYEAALKRSPRVVVAGDLNDSPDSDPLQSLLATSLQDAMSHSSYAGAPGTFGTGQSLKQKIDYLMFSPELWDQVQAVDVERRGIFAPHTFKSFPTVTSKETEASDHGALYADLDI